MGQCWSRSLPAYGVTVPQWVKARDAKTHWQDNTLWRHYGTRDIQLLSLVQHLKISRVVLHNTENTPVTNVTHSTTTTQRIFFLSCIYFWNDRCNRVINELQPISVGSGNDYDVTKESCLATILLRNSQIRVTSPPEQHASPNSSHLLGKWRNICGWTWSIMMKYGECEISLCPDVCHTRITNVRVMINQCHDNHTFCRFWWVPFH